MASRRSWNRLLSAAALALAAVSAVIFVLTASGAGTELLLGALESPFPVAYYNIATGVLPTMLWLAVLTGLWLSEQPGLARRLFGLALILWLIYQFIMNLPPLLFLSPRTPETLMNMSIQLGVAVRPLSIVWPMLFCYGIARSSRFPRGVGRLALVWAWIQALIKLVHFIAIQLPTANAALVDTATALTTYLLPIIVMVVLVAIGLTLARGDSSRSPDPACV